MAILDEDVGLWKSRVMADTDDEGGPMIGALIPNGEMANVFGPIATLVREATGYVYHRTVFAGVATPDLQTYYKVLVFLFKPPVDPNVHVSLFDTGGHFDTWREARDKFERYLARGIRWPGRLLEMQVEGSRAILVYQKPGVELPDIGAVYVLVANEGTAAEAEQYVRVVQVDAALRTFRIVEGSSPRDVVFNVLTIRLADPLEVHFDGGAVTDNDAVKPPAVLRTTLVANAVKHFSIKPLSEAAASGAMTVQVPSLYHPLVPAARSEVALVDLTVAGESPVVAAADGTVSFTTGANLGPGLSLYLGNGCLPGSLSIPVAGGTITDAGGELKLNGLSIGTVNYASGLLSFANASGTYAGSKTVTFRPAAAPLRVADTAALAVEQQSRGYVYTLTLAPIPQPGTLRVSYLAEGKWYTLRDAGNGVLSGASTGYGSGSLSFTTGTVVVTTGALPDIGSEIVFAWGTAVNYFRRADRPVAAPSIRHIVAHPGIAPGTVAVTWTDGEATKTATDDGHGMLTGDASGTVRYATGEIVLTPATLPAGGAEFVLGYDWGPPVEEAFAHPLRNPDGTVTVTLDGGDLQPGSIELEWNLLIEDYESISTVPAELQLWPRIDPIKIAKDNGQGGFQGGVTGTVDYLAGTVTFLPDLTVSIPVPRYSVVQIGRTREGDRLVPVYRNTFIGFEYVPAGASMPYDESGWVKVRYRPVASAQSATETVTVAALETDLTTGFNETLVPGSVRFTLGGKTYLDRAGTLVADVDPATGAGISAGTIDYATGRVSLSVWTPGQANAVTVHSLLTQIGGQPVDEVVFRIPAAPIRPGSLQIRAVPLTGGQVTATAGDDGVISTATMRGSVNYQTGLVRVRFGTLVTAAGHEGEIWYDAGAVIDGYIFQPKPVFADTLLFNAVAYSYLPMPPDRIGVNANRFPADGRVPVFRVGDVVVAHHTTSLALPVPITPGSTHSAGRDKLSRVQITDAHGVNVPAGATTWSAHLAAGSVTFSQNLNLSAYVQPFTLIHTVMDRRVVSEVDISGRIGLNLPLLHEFPEGSYLSSAVEKGDLRARVDQNTLFTQATWSTATPVWSDVRQGSEPAFQFDRLNFQVQVTNAGAIQQRWVCVLVSTTTYDCYGEDLGKLNDGPVSIHAEFAPFNPSSPTTANPAGAPYFVIPAGALSPGAAGNAFRFNTRAAQGPVRVIRTVLPGESSVATDAFEILCLGDTDE